ncbi:uncharacterized protein [Dysidea avara]|uniref:uncharacterized protein isoform X2 n=1 Tax=Dysidea avara TaxID=196820 RepID=UPI00331943CE
MMSKSSSKSSQYRGVWLSPKTAKEQIGLGTYGKVFKVNHCGATCTAKELYVAPKGFYGANNCDEFLKWCRVIADLRHPNLVQFFGASLSEGTYRRLPLLVMEMMEESLTSLLERCSRPDSNTQLGFKHKLSILLHVSHGLLYLHSYNPPIAHCTLSSNKILLNHSGTVQMQAKISDSGVVNLIQPNTSANTKFPGREFLPLWNVTHFTVRNDLSLDIFSYGGIMLHTVTQTWPRPSAPKHHKTGGTDSFEIARRSKYIEMIKTDEVDCLELKNLLKNCLNDSSHLRPDIKFIAKRLEDIVNSQAVYPDNTSTGQHCGASHVTKQSSKVAGDVCQTDPHSATPSLWKIPMNKLGGFQQAFRELDRENRGILSYEKMHSVLSQLQLDKANISNIWRLFDQSGGISINEFCAVMWLAEKVIKEGISVPDTLPHELLISSGDNSGSNTLLWKEKQEVDLEKSNKKLEQMNIELSKEIKEKHDRITSLESDCNQKDIEIENLKKKLGNLPVAKMSKVKNMVECVVVSQPMSVAVLLRNNHGELVSGRSDCIEVLSASMKSNTSESLPLDIKDHRNGWYNISFTIGHSGEYDLYIMVSGYVIPEMPCRIQCLKVMESALDPRFGPKVKPLRNHSTFICYFNVVLQVLNQSQGVAEIRSKYHIDVKRLYSLSITDPNTLETLSLAFEVSGNPGPLLKELNKILDQIKSDEMSSLIIEPESLLYQLADISKQQRFAQQTQEDSHELLRHVLYELKKEEVNLIKDQLYFNFKVTADPESQKKLTKDVKAQLKSLLRAASKETTPIEEVFGGVKLNSVICRECMMPSQTCEPFFDISLGVMNSSAQNTASSSVDEGKYQHQYKKGQSKNNVFTGNRGSTHQCTSKADVKFNVKSVQSLLEKKHMPYLPPCVTKIATNLERSLADHTEVDNMDEDNKFICNECMKNKGGDDSPILCLVAKQIMIHKLPKVLVLHIKRFTISDNEVKKDSTHVSFPSILDMAPYCSNTCLEKFNDAKGNIFYGLYAAIEHKGNSLKSGHYVAYIRRRPNRSPTQCDAKGEYDQTAAHDGKWFYTSDLAIRECQWGFEQVKDCKAYMLFYELLPRKQATIV